MQDRKQREVGGKEWEKKKQNELEEKWVKWCVSLFLGNTKFKNQPCQTLRLLKSLSSISVRDLGSIQFWFIQQNPSSTESEVDISEQKWVMLHTTCTWILGADDFRRL